MKISALYIVKNEEKNIEKSIFSIINDVDEIIVVDTGSTDNTIDICKKYNCSIYHYKWKEDFSDARNFAISKAKSDWILFLDADEYFSNKTNGELKKIIDFSENNNKEFVKFLIHNIDVSKNNKTISSSYSLKLFKNKNGLRYDGKIHEELDMKFFSDGSVYLENPIFHTGYGKNINIKKIKRNIDILESIKNKTTKDYFYLSRENLSINNIVETEKYLNLFFNRKDVRSFIENFNLGYSVYLIKAYVMEKQGNSIENVISFLESSKKFIKSSDINYQLGLLYMKISNYLSEKNFIESINSNNEKEQNNIEVHTEFPMYQSYIYYNLSILDYRNRKINEAINNAIVSCLLYKENGLFFRNLCKLCKNVDCTKMIDLIKKIYTPNNTGSYEFIISNLVNTQHHETFIYFSLEYNTKYNGGSPSVIMAMLLSKNYETAIDTIINLYNIDKNNYYLYLLTVALLYIDKKEYYKKYDEILNDKLLRIIKYLRYNKGELEKDDFDCVSDIFTRLIYLKEYTFIKIKNLNILDSKSLYHIISSLFDVSEYKMIIEIVESRLNIVESNEIILLYLESLYFTNRNKQLKNKFNYFSSLGYDLNSVKYMLESE